MSAFPALAVMTFSALLLGVVGFSIAGWAHKHTLLVRLQGVVGSAPESDLLPNGLVEFLQRLGARLPGAKDDALRAELLRAGYFMPVAGPMFVALRFLSTIAVVALVLLLKGFGTGGLFFATFAGVLFSRLFLIFLKMRAEARAKLLRSELPPVIDVLLMVLNSGVSIDQCLRHVTGILERTAPLTTKVLKRYVADIDSGVPYDAAFERFGQRLGMDEGHDLAAMIKQALLQGGEILGPLERFGAELSEKRVAAAREQIGRKSIYLTLVMLAFFMPVLLTVLAGPAISKITETLTRVQHEVHHREVKR